MFVGVKEEKTAVKSQKVIFRKSQKLLTKRAPQRQPIQNIQFQWRGYVTAVLAFVRAELPASTDPGGEQFL